MTNAPQSIDARVAPPMDTREIMIWQAQHAENKINRRFDELRNRAELRAKKLVNT